MRLTKPHNHEPDLKLLARLMIRNKILEETLNSDAPLKEVYKNATVGEDRADLKEFNLDFNSICRLVTTNKKQLHWHASIIRSYQFYILGL